MRYPTKRPLNLRPRTLAALLILLTVLAYLPAIGAGYVWDDDTLLTANPQMHGIEGLSQIWRGENSRDYTPVTLTSFWLEWRLWGLNPAGYHVVNILLHALSALLLWRILERLRVPGAWLGALLFAIHPVNAASVAWIAERKNTLAFALFLGSVLCYLAGRDGKQRALYLGSIGLFLLAALSKGAVVTMPAVLLLCVLWKDRAVTRRDLWQVVPYFVIAAAAALLTIRFQSRAQHYGLLPDTLDYRISRAGASIWCYLGALFWPAGMSPMRPPWLPNLRSPLAYLPALAATVAPALFFWKRRRWGRPLLFAYTYYLVMLLPVLGFVWMTLMQETPGADWWQYMAAPGILACVAGGIVTASPKWRSVMPVACVAIALLAVQTWRRASIYHSLETYCRAVTAEDRYAWTLENNLGVLLKRQGRYPEAEACYEQAIQDNPLYPDARVNLGNLGGLLLANRQYAEAESCLRDAARLSPESIVLRIELCEALAAQRKKGEALEVCAQVEQLARKSGAPEAIAAAAKLRHACEAAPRP